MLKLYLQYFRFFYNCTQVMHVKYKLLNIQLYLTSRYNNNTTFQVIRDIYNMIILFY